MAKGKKGTKLIAKQWANGRIPGRHRQVARWAPLWDFRFMSQMEEVSAVDTDVFEVIMHLRQVRALETLDALVEEGEELYPPYQHLAQSLWSALYNKETQVRNEKGSEVLQAMMGDENKKHLLEEYPPWYPYHTQIMNEVTQLPEFQALRDKTQFSTVYSSLGSMELDGAVKEILRRNQKLANALSDAARNGSTPEESRQLAKDIKDNAEKLKQEIKDAMAQAAGNASEKVDEADQTLRQAGCEPPTMGTIDPQQYMSLVETFKTPKYKKYLDMVGRMTRTARGRSAKVMGGTYGRERVTSRGDDLSRAPFYELMQMKIACLRPFFLQAFASGELIQHSGKTTAPAGRGPIIVLVDESGSMQRGPLQIAKALFVATQKIAKEQNRPVAYIGFSTQATTWFDCSTPDGLNKAMVSNYDGGTDFTAPLQRTLEAYKALGSRFKQADVVMLTDGQATVEETFLRRFNYWKKKTGSRVFGIILGKGARDRGLKPFADTITRIDELATVEDAEKAFEKVWDHIGDEADKPQFTSSAEQKAEKLTDEDEDW